MNVLQVNRNNMNSILDRTAVCIFIYNLLAYFYLTVITTPFLVSA